MQKKSIHTDDGDWDPTGQEPWYFEFKKKPVNDERWTCIVTAAVENEAQDEEHIRTYAEIASTGLRKSIKIISVADVTKLLRSMENSRNSLRKPSKTEKTISIPRRPSRFSRVLDLVMKHATFTEGECKLPPELMATVLKWMILNLKDENRLQKRADAERERKTMEQTIKSKFIRDLKPFVIRQDSICSGTARESLLQVKEPINDAPIDGPDLYVLLTDFHNAFYFSELQSANVPFVAVLKISTQRVLGHPFHTSESEVGLANRRKSSSARLFWEQLNALENSLRMKNIAVMEYQAPSKDENPTLDYPRVLFDELTWTQYSAYRVLMQHEKYLKELRVQRLILSLRPLDLSECGVYNKLCDALVTGGPLTPLLVLHAMVEQVVAGVPDTDGSILEYSGKKSDSFSASSGSGKSPVVEDHTLKTPCVECRHKKFVDVCQRLKDGQGQLGSVTSGKSEPCENSGKDSENLRLSQEQLAETSGVLTGDSGVAASEHSEFFDALISQIVSERRREWEVREEKVWKAPRVCFYGDSVTFQSLHCDPRLFNSEGAVDRFLRNAALFEIWKKYPELPPEERAFCNFHFYSLWKASDQTKEKLRLKVLFTLSMRLAGRAETRRSPGVEVFEQEPARSSQNRWVEEENRNFQNYFFKTFIIDRYFRVKKRTDVEDLEHSVQDVNFPSFYHNSEACLPKCFRHFENRPGNSSVSPHDRVLMTFYYLLDCFEISNLTEPQFIENIKNYEDVIKRFKYYEFLESKLMIQRLLEAQEDFNTVQTSYYAPTDTIVMVMRNDSDYRGVFSTCESQALATPVALRDFYCHVYPEIGKWLINENAEHEKFVSELGEKIKREEEEKNAKYLSFLKMQYCKMNEEQRKEFLEDEDTQEPEVVEKEVADLPLRPKPPPPPPDRISFLATNFTDVRVENRKKMIEYNSQDGTQVRVTFDSWLYTPSELLQLRIKRSRFLLHYNQWLNQGAVNQDFLFRTTSDVIFSFRKDKKNKINYEVTVSWPTGLLVQPVLEGTGLYVKQTYLQPYRRGWDIEGENSRCFLDNGQVVVLKEGGDYDVLFGSGTKITFHDSATTAKFEIATTTGKIWQIPTKGPCKNRRKLVGTNKVLEGVDPKTGETFHKREDGVTSMLWPNGTLVTNYPDGTKITTTPFFGEEMAVEWTEEETQYFSDLLLRLNVEAQLVQEPKNRTILRNSTSPKSTQRFSIDPTLFVTVSCSYLFEHPKYSRISFDPREPYVQATMPENLDLLIYPEGNYKVNQDGYLLEVKGEVVEFIETCKDCKGQSSVELKLDGSEVLCRCIDFFEKAFFVHRDGRTRFQECYSESEGEFECGGKAKKPCERGHAINECLKQRCFAFRRDLSGVEFLQEDSIALSLSQIPEGTYFDLDSNDPDNITHTFNIPFYKIGYENWEMEYLEKKNSVPVNLKKKDLKELGVKQTPKNTFKYPFPKHHNPCLKSAGRRNPDQPKVVVTRTIRCLSQSPPSVIFELQKYVTEYQKKARKIFQEYLNHKGVDGRTDDSRYIAMRLRKIAVTLNQSLHMYPHLCTNFPSTEKDIHYFGHFINTGESLKAHRREAFDLLPDCSQIPLHFPTPSGFSCIYEESESPHT